MESKLHTSKPHSCNSYFVLARRRHCFLPWVVTPCLFLRTSSYLLHKYFKLRFICFHSTIPEFKQEVVRQRLARGEESNQSGRSVFITVAVRINARLPQHHCLQMPDENVFLATVWSQIIIFKSSYILLTYLIILSNRSKLWKCDRWCEVLRTHCSSKCSGIHIQVSVRRHCNLTVTSSYNTDHDLSFLT